MTRDHFAKTFKSPYFQSERYQESSGGKLEKKIENFFQRIFKKQPKSN